MAVGLIPNFWLADASETQAHKYIVKAGAAATIKAGDLVLQNTAGDVEYVKAVGTATADTDDIVIGIAATTSTDTAAADGTVMVYDDLDATIVGLADTKGNLTDANLLTAVPIDSSAAGVQRLNENDVTKGICFIKKYSASTGEIEFTIKRSAILGA